jgi:hypothetical protein
LQKFWHTCPDPVAVPVDEALDDGQADAGAFIFLAAMQPFKDSEPRLGLGLINPDAIILDVIYGFLPLDVRLHFDADGLFGLGVFDGIAQQIHHHLVDQGIIPPVGWFPTNYLPKSGKSNPIFMVFTHGASPWPDNN